MACVLPGRTAIGFPRRREKGVGMTWQTVKEKIAFGGFLVAVGFSFIVFFLVAPVIFGVAGMAIVSAPGILAGWLRDFWNDHYSVRVFVLSWGTLFAIAGLMRLPALWRDIRDIRKLKEDIEAIGLIITHVDRLERVSRKNRKYIREIQERLPDQGDESE